MYYPDYFLIGPIDDHKYNIEKSNRKVRLPCLFEPCVPVFLRVFWSWVKYIRKLNYTYHIGQTMNLTKTLAAEV